MALTFQKVFLGSLSLLLAFVLSSDVTAQQEPPTLDPTEIRESHRQLAEAKRQAMIDWQFYRKLTEQAGPASTQTNYDVLWHDIHILTDDDPDVYYDTLHTEVKFYARATEDGVSDVQIDFNGDRPIDSIIAPSGALSFSRTGDVVTVSLDRTYDTDERFEFEVFCRSIYPFSWRQASGMAVLATYSEPYSARNWWPCKDRPDDKADSFKIAVTVDTGFYVGSNGTLDSVVYEGDRWHTFYYTEHYPMVTYLFSLAISGYTVWYDEWVHNSDQDTMLITNAVFPDVYQISLESYGVVPGALTIFSDLFGPYPFADEKYGHSNDNGNGGMEHQTMSTMGTTDRIFSEWVVVHELAHQWWGDMITCRSWGHLWLNEGFATYCEALYFEQKYDHPYYLDYMTGIEYHDPAKSVYVYDTTYSSTNFFSLAQYDKGGWVLHMLRRLVGDSLFFAGLQAYYSSEYQHSTATTEEFRDIMETVTGWELDWYFDQWVYGFYMPNYQWSYWHEPSDTGGSDVFIIIEQTQTTDPQVFTMPVDIFFKQDGSTDTTHTLWVDERSELFKLNFDLNDIILQRFDPDNWVLDVNQQTAWGIRIVTLQEEVSEGQQYLPYVDTIEAKGGYGVHTFSITDGAPPSGYNMDSNGIITGVTSDTGLFTFTVYVEEQGPSDQVEFTLTIAPTPVTAGDVNYDGSVNVADISHLVEYIFQEGPPPPIADLADVDASCSINVADVNYLVDYLFYEGPEPVMGCVM